MPDKEKIKLQKWLKKRWAAYKIVIGSGKSVKMVSLQMCFKPFSLEICQKWWSLSWGSFNQKTLMKNDCNCHQNIDNEDEEALHAPWQRSTASPVARNTWRNQTKVCSWDTRQVCTLEHFLCASPIAGGTCRFQVYDLIRQVDFDGQPCAQGILKSMCIPYLLESWRHMEALLSHSLHTHKVIIQVGFRKVNQLYTHHIQYVEVC